MTRLCLTFALSLLFPFSVEAQTSWDPEIYDPGSARGGADPADLILPLPCGGAMAFQKVSIPMDATNPLADVEVRLGQTGSGAGYLDYLRNEYLRGSFVEPEGSATYYYLARYELTIAQYQALTESDCDFRVSRRETIAQGGLSWFDGIALSRAYTEWLHANAEDMIPSEDGQKAFVRLPTEVEWEYAARGGAAVSPGEFGGIRFPMEEPVDAYARFDGERAGPVGVKKANPLSIFDLYGNVEEIVFDPFRLNAIGQAHGQAGGMVVRGGSYQTSGEQMRSSNRKEWPFYNRRGTAQAQDTFGIRFAIAVHVGTSDTRVREIRDAWTSGFEAGPGEDISAGSVLSSYIESELDPVRKSRLEGVLLTLKNADERAREAADAQLQTTLRGAAIFLTGIWDDSTMIAALDDFIADDQDYLDTYKADLSNEEALSIDENIAALEDARSVRNDRRVLSVEGYREALEFIAGAPEEALNTALAIVQRSFEEAENNYLSSALKAAMVDLSAYAARPDMDSDALNELAVER